MEDLAVSEKSLMDLVVEDGKRMVQEEIERHNIDAFSYSIFPAQPIPPPTRRRRAWRWLRRKVVEAGSRVRDAWHHLVRGFCDGCGGDW